MCALCSVLHPICLKQLFVGGSAWCFAVCCTCSFLIAAFAVYGKRHQTYSSEPPSRIQGEPRPGQPAYPAYPVPTPAPAPGAGFWDDNPRGLGTTAHKINLDVFVQILRMWVCVKVVSKCVQFPCDVWRSQILLQTAGCPGRTLTIAEACAAAATGIVGETVQEHGD